MVKPKCKPPKRGRKPKSVKASKAIKLNKMWERLTESQRKRLVVMGFDSFAWNNNVKERVAVQDFELIYVGGDTSLIGQVRPMRVKGTFLRRKFVVDEDAYRITDND